MQSIIKINMFLKTNANEKGKVCNSMENTRVIVVYADGNLSVSVNGTKLNTESIKGKPIDEWFEVSNGRDGWKGLIPEIQVYVGNVQLDFEFSGAQEDKAIFEKCLKKRGFVCSTDGLPKEEVMQINLEDAKKAEQRGLWKEAFEGYKKAAEYGNSIEAQYKVGEIYYKVSKGELSVSGIDVESAVGKAIQYLEKAAKTDNANAKYYLYKALLDIPENQNEEEAIKWLKEAAQLGLAEAQSELGVCYQTGRGVEKKLEEAVGWFQKAADQNDAFAQNRLGNRYQLGEGVSKDLEKAFQWFQRAADGGFVKAYLNLAKCYCFGNGTEKDLNEAERYLRKYIEKIMENKELKDRFIDEKKGIEYIRKGDFYFPNLVDSASVNKSELGKYGKLRLKYLLEHKKVEYTILWLDNKLRSHLLEIDKTANERFHLLMKQFAEQENITEELKATNQMEWVRCMNNIKNRVEEIIFKELIYV